MPVQPPFRPEPLTMTYGAANRLATYNGSAVQFDDDGNMVYGPLDGQMDTFGYDSRNRLVQAGSTIYRYDAENRRIGVDGADFVVNSQPALSQVLVKAENGVQTFYVYGLGLIGEDSAAGYRAYHFDLRGSTVALSDAAGAVTARFRYSAYGLLLGGDAAVTPFLFNGMYGVMADGNGLYHMRARFYSAEIRRFLNRDVLLGNVVRGQSLNRFGFAKNNPLLFIDPHGLWVEAVYNITTGLLVVTDKQTKKTVVLFDVISGTGDPNDQYLPDKGPIPVGTYLIGEARVEERFPGDNIWYRLYGKDGNNGYSYTQIPVETPTGNTVTRGFFNLHTGSHSLGCVIVPSDIIPGEDGYPQSAQYNRLKELLNTTSRLDYNNSNYTGWLTVVE